MTKKQIHAYAIMGILYKHLGREDYEVEIDDVGNDYFSVLVYPAEEVESDLEEVKGIVKGIEWLYEDYRSVKVVLHNNPNNDPDAEGFVDCYIAIEVEE
jgi:hypothetical protein